MQTEDSGVNNPHIFTHLFHGGVILASRRVNYEAAAADDIVKGLMQSQHKAVLKELNRGALDDRIDEYLGDTEGLLPRGASEGTPAPAKKKASDVSAAFEALTDDKIGQAAGEEEAAQIHSPPPPSAPEPPGLAKAPAARQRPESQPAPPSSGGYSQQHPTAAKTRIDSPAGSVQSPGSRQHRASVPNIPRTGTGGLASRGSGNIPARTGTGNIPARTGSGRIPNQQPPAASGPVRRTQPSGVVVSRPAVIVGAPPAQVVGGQAPARRRNSRDTGDGLFGQDLISERSLDEVILAYLSEDGQED